MNWQQVIEEPSLQNLPFKIETDEKGRIILSERKIRHSVLQSKIGYDLRVQKTSGKVFPECAVQTKKGVKVAEVVWTSDELFSLIRDEIAASIAPELCVEVLSMNNYEEEMTEKCELYFERGAKEVWICDEYGEVRFYDQTGELATSKLFSKFPIKIVV